MNNSCCVLVALVLRPVLYSVAINNSSTRTSTGIRPRDLYTQQRARANPPHNNPSSKFQSIDHISRRMDNRWQRIVALGPAANVATCWLALLGNSAKHIVRRTKNRTPVLLCWEYKHFWNTHALGNSFLSPTYTFYQLQLKLQLLLYIFPIV